MTPSKSAVSRPCCLPLRDYLAKTGRPLGAEMQTSTGLESMRGTASLTGEEAEQTEKGRGIGRLGFLFCIPCTKLSGFPFAVRISHTCRGVYQAVEVFY